jgi:hypothetical protein
VLRLGDRDRLEACVDRSPPSGLGNTAHCRSVRDANDDRVLGPQDHACPADRLGGVI